MKIVLSVVCICLYFVSPTWAIKDDKALMLYFPFDNVKGDVVEDQSGNGLEGVLQGAVWSPDGIIGGAIELEDRTQFVEVDAVPELDITDALTFEAWFFPMESQGDSNLMSRRTAANQGGYVLQWSAQFTGSPQIETWISIGGWQGTRQKQTIEPKLEEWHHVASTFDGAMIRQYIDGKLDVEFAPPNGKIDSVDVVFRIGSSQTGLEGMVGKVDEVAVYNRALSLEEIQLDMDNGVIFSVSPAEKLATTWAQVKRR